MKNKLTLFHFSSLASVLSLLFSFGCGDIEDVQEVTNSTHNMLRDEPDEQHLQLEGEELKLLKDLERLRNKNWKRLKDKEWEKLKGEDWVRLTNKEVEEFMNLVIPQRWGFEVDDPALRQKYRHATLFQKFGNIPQVRYIVEFDRMRGGGIRIITLEFAKQLTAEAAATYFLFPNADNQRFLEEAKNQLKVISEEEEIRFLDQLRIENPEVWVKGMRAFLIRQHGDIPEVDIIIEFLRKLELRLPRADKECHAYIEVYISLYDHINTASIYEFYALLEALHQVRRFVRDPPSRTLEKYREARAAGISLYDIDWDDP